jgi:Flp pilus assembly protein TadG
MLGKHWRAFQAQVAKFMRARRGNVAMIFALSLVPLTVAAGAGLDLSRALMERARLAEALDAAGLAVGASQNLSTDQIQQLATAYFDANYTIDPSFGARPQLQVTPGEGTVTLSASVDMPTTLMHVVGINTLSVGYSSKIVWGQTKLWVALVLDNTGSMCQPYRSDGPCTDVPSGKQTKIGALKTATSNLLTLLKGASAHDGDVLVSIVPFTKDVNVGTSHAGDSWINWSDWESAPANGTPSSSVGPGSSCPYSTRDEGYVCQSTPVNGSSSVSSIPSSGTYAGYICPGVDNGSDNNGRASRYYNGCYNSTPITRTVSSCWGKSNCTCTGGWNSVCTQISGYSHAWIVNDHSTWTGCVMDRNQDYDVSVTTPTSSGTNFYAENSTTCYYSSTVNLAPITPLTDIRTSSGWATLSDAVDAMQANGNTNQTIGIIHGIQTLMSGNPYNAGTLPPYTSKVLIILSDGLNTQNRWSSSANSINDREKLACQAAKDQGAVIYTLFVDLNGAQGDSTPLKDCATDTSHYFDLTSADQIDTAFKTIGTQITQLRVAQ